MIINIVDTDLSDNTLWTNIDCKFTDCLSEKETLAFAVMIKPNFIM